MYALSAPLFTNFREQFQAKQTKQPQFKDFLINKLKLI